MSGTLTPNFRLRKPPFDDIPWDEAVNGNMDIIDAALAQYLTIANFVGVWKNAQAYSISQAVIDPQDSSTWRALVSHTSPSAPTTFAQARAAAPSQWTPAAATVASTTSMTNGYKNKIINGMMSVHQRGTPSTSVNAGYIVDRWFLSVISSTATAGQATFSAANVAPFNDEQIQYGINCNFAGTNTAFSQVAIAQRMENVRELSFKPVTVSFWAWSPTSLKIGYSLTQNFGTGGSPSPLNNLPGASVALTPTPTRYSGIFSVPSVAGKVIGTDPHSDYTQLAFWLSSEDDTGGFSGGVGVQSGQILITGVQVEIGGIMTELEKPPIAQEVALCQRYFQSGLYNNAGYAAATGITYAHIQPFLVAMRITPIITNTPVQAVNVKNQSLSPTSSGMLVTTEGNAIGGFIFSGSYAANADFI